MNWFNGPIANAIFESKTRQLIFLVYTYDSNSNEMNELWNDESVSEPCNQHTVSLRLESGSEPCNQFKQIYPINAFPTTYFIGINGAPLDVISGNVTKEELINRIQKAIESQKKAIAPAKPVESQSESSSDTASANPTTSQQASEIDSESARNEQRSLEERVALAKEKLRLIQEKKRAEEEENERNREVERRRMGQEILKAKKDKEDQELRRIAEEKRREKLEDELAKQRIKERIQQDREDKQRKYAQDREEVEKAKEAAKIQKELEKQQEKLTEAANRSQIARIQFRLIDGSSIVNQFDPEQKLNDARQFISDKLREMNESQSFTMHSTFPKRDYTQQDMSLTLRELQLAPSASILIIPTRSKAAKAIGNFLPTKASSSTSSNSSSLVTYANDLLGFVFLPLTIIWGLITSFFGASGSRNTSSNSTNSNSASASASASTSTQNRSSNGQQESISNLRRRNLDNTGSRPGGVRSLHDNNKDDDENATWNGNSTQQM